MAPTSAPGNDREGFRPIPVESAAGRPVMFWLRCLVDLQLATIVKHLHPALGQLTGDVLDVGAGQAPWRGWLPTTTTYHRIDIATAYEFGTDRCRSDITYYDGTRMPFDDATFNAAICIEVLEHSEDPQVLAGEMARVLKPGGTLLTAPWSARLHNLPHDCHRFTRTRLQALLAQTGFENISMLERGNDVGAIANKLTVLAIRLFRPVALGTRRGRSCRGSPLQRSPVRLSSRRMSPKRWPWTRNKIRWATSSRPPGRSPADCSPSF